MFDVSFTELMLVGVIALIVIGPERLPKVARTIGHLVGRAQRYVSDVKTDIRREMDLDELTNLKGQMEEAAKSVKSSMQEAGDDLRKPLAEAQEALKEASSSVESLVESTKAEARAQESKQDGKPAALAEAPADEGAQSLPLPGMADPDLAKTKTGTPT